MSTRTSEDIGAAREGLMRAVGKINAMPGLGEDEREGYKLAITAAAHVLMWLTSDKPSTPADMILASARALVANRRGSRQAPASDLLRLMGPRCGEVAA